MHKKIYIYSFIRREVDQSTWPVARFRFFRFGRDFNFKQRFLSFRLHGDVENFKRHHLLCRARYCCCIYAQIYVIFMRRHNYKSRLCWRIPIPTTKNERRKIQTNKNQPMSNDLQFSFVDHILVRAPMVWAGVGV